MHKVFINWIKKFQVIVEEELHDENGLLFLVKFFFIFIFFYFLEVNVRCERWIRLKN